MSASFVGLQIKRRQNSKDAACAFGLCMYGLHRVEINQRHPCDLLHHGPSYLDDCVRA